MTIHIFKSTIQQFRTSSINLFLTAILCIFFISINSNIVCADELKTELKSGIQKILINAVPRIPRKEFGRLPKGLQVVEAPNFRGVKVYVGYMCIKADIWKEDIGLMERYKVLAEEDKNLVFSVNGTFYSSRGVLGHLISDGIIPSTPKQFPGTLPRCFLVSFKGIKGSQHWFIGETTVQTSIIKSNIFDKVWFNGENPIGSPIDQLLGGGGWIMRDRRDVHNESYDRQRFRFYDEDKTARRTVVAQDTDRNLYFLIFEAGQTLHMIAREFIKNPIFKDVKDAFFLDGGASSCMVLKGKYLVAPLYLVDKARFSAITVSKEDISWISGL